jgi:hypothetical protein
MRARTTTQCAAMRHLVHARISAQLAALDDERFARALSDATPLGTGIGGTVSSLIVDGVSVFVKRVALTDLERAPENVRSTANLFGLPECFQYGISSAGFGAWRELEAHLQTTRWVLSSECPAFPLLFHWRVLPTTERTQPASARRLTAWGNSSAIGERLDAIDKATASLVLVMERFPGTLRSWLEENQTASTLAWAERGLLAATSFLAGHGFIHFDAHLENVLTDGRAIYLSDFGQALSTGFALTASEAERFTRHLDYDRSYVVTKLGALMGESPGGAELARRYASVTAVMNDFFVRLRADRTTATYPHAALANAWRELLG